MMSKAKAAVTDATSAFKVIPEVYIHDHSLQMLNLMLKGAIFFYIVVWSIAMDKQYLVCYTAEGTSKLHARRLRAATDQQCAAIGMPRTAGHQHNGEYYSTDDWCEDWPEYTEAFAPTNPHAGRRQAQAGSEGDSWECYKRGTGELELAYDQVGTELPSGFNTLSYRFKYGTSPQFDGTRLVSYDTESYVLYFNDLILSAPYITGGNVMADTTMGGNQYEIMYTLVDSSGGVINTCTNVNKAAFDWRDTCGAGPFNVPCSFTENEAMVLPVKSLLESAGVSSLDQKMSTVDNDAAEACMRERFYRLGGTPESWESAVEVGFLDGDIAALSYDEFKRTVQDSCDELTFRTASWTMFIVFECQNMQASRGKFAGPWNSANIHCFLHTRVRFREDLAQETQGVEIQVIHTGDICQASLSRMLVTLTSSFALLAASNKITSLVMRSIHPRKEVFKKFIFTHVAKSELSVESSKEREGVGSFKERETQQAWQEDGESAHPEAGPDQPREANDPPGGGGAGPGPLGELPGLPGVAGRPQPGANAEP